MVPHDFLEKRRRRFERGYIFGVLGQKLGFFFWTEISGQKTVLGFWKRGFCFFYSKIRISENIKKMVSVSSLGF